MDWENWPAYIGSEIEFSPEVYKMKIEREKKGGKNVYVSYAGWLYRGNSYLLKGIIFFFLILRDL